MLFRTWRVPVGAAAWAGGGGRPSRSATSAVSTEKVGRGSSRCRGPDSPPRSRSRSEAKPVLNHARAIKTRSCARSSRAPPPRAARREGRDRYTLVGSATGPPSAWATGGTTPTPANGSSRVRLRSQSFPRPATLEVTRRRSSRGDPARGHASSVRRPSMGGAVRRADHRPAAAVGHRRRRGGHSTAGPATDARTTGDGGRPPGPPFPVLLQRKPRSPGTADHRRHRRELPARVRDDTSAWAHGDISRFRRGRRQEPRERDRLTAALLPWDGSG